MSKKRERSLLIGTLISAVITIFCLLYSQLGHAQKVLPKQKSLTQTTQGRLPARPGGLRKQPAAQKPASAASSKAGNMQLSPPTLEVQALSGDFANWTRAMTINSKQNLRFRWQRRHAAGKSAIVEMYATGLHQSFRPTSPTRIRPVTILPGANQWGTFFWNPFAGIGINKKLTFRLIIKDANGKPISKASNSVVVTYKGASNKTQKFQLDSVKLAGVVKPKPLIGSAYGDSSLNKTNSVELMYRYDLHTEQAAEIRQWLLTKHGSVASNNFWSYTTVQRGKGTASTRATIQCKTPTQKATKIYAIKIVMNRAKNTGVKLVEKTHKLATPIVFSCKNTPKDNFLKITQMSPNSGSTLMGMPNGGKMSQSNSVLVKYSYGLYSTKHAELRQRPYLANGAAAPNNLWTWQPIDKTGKGSAQNRFTVKCMSRTQKDTVVTKLRIMLIDANSKKYLVDRYVPVNFRFRCRSLQLKKQSIKQR